MDALWRLIVLLLVFGFSWSSRHQEKLGNLKVNVNPGSVGKKKLLFLYRKCRESCGPGRECSMDLKTLQVTCRCKQHCTVLKLGKERVCGTDDVTYKSFCELHRTACLSDRNVQMKHKGSCIPKVTVQDNVFYVFGSNGISIVEPQSQLVVRRIKHNEQIYGTDEIMCTPNILAGIKCDWVDAVSGNTRYVFALDYSRKRVIVIDTRKQIPIASVRTTWQINKLYYIEVSDELWMVSRDRAAIGVIADGNGQTRIRLMSNVKNYTFVDLSKRGSSTSFPLSLISENCGGSGRREPVRYYVDGNSPGLFSLDLRTRKVVGFKNLSAVGCNKALDGVFSNLDGLLFIVCNQGIRSRLFVFSPQRDVLVSNETVATNGVTFVSPDGKFVIITSQHEISVFYWDTWKKSLQLISELQIYSFYPSMAAFSRISRGFIVYLTSKQRPNVLKLRITYNSVDVNGFITNVGKAAKFSGQVYERTLEEFRRELKKWFNDTGTQPTESELMIRARTMYLNGIQRPITTGCGWNDRFIASPAAVSDEVAIIDGWKRRLVGIVKGIAGPQQVAWVGRGW